jgi:hypothetical protein
MSSDNLSCMIVRLDLTGKFEGVPYDTPELKADGVETVTDGVNQKSERTTSSSPNGGRDKNQEQTSPPPNGGSDKVAKG